MGKKLKDETQILALGKWLRTNFGREGTALLSWHLSLGPSELTRGDKTNALQWFQSDWPLVSIRSAHFKF